MSDRPPLSGRWFSLGALLPAEVRRRLFEPAYYDLLREHLLGRGEGARSWPFGLRALRLWAGSSCHGTVLMLRDRSRRQRLLLGFAVMAVFISLVAAMLLRDWLLHLASLYASASG